MFQASPPVFLQPDPPHTGNLTGCLQTVILEQPARLSGNPDVLPGEHSQDFTRQSSTSVVVFFNVIVSVTSAFN